MMDKITIISQASCMNAENEINQKKKMDEKKLNISDDEDKTLAHCLEQWKLLNEYINKIDLGHQNPMLILISFFIGLIGVVAGSEDNMVKSCILFIPIGVEAVMAYVSYQFRIVAILRGYIASLEDRMNELLKTNTYRWNSMLVETHMAHRNLINNTMMVPIGLVFIIMAVFCFLISFNVLGGTVVGNIILLIYWTLIIIFAILIFLPFLKNGAIRKITRNQEVIEKMYMEYKDK